MYFTIYDIIYKRITKCHIKRRIHENKYEYSSYEYYIFNISFALQFFFYWRSELMQEIFYFIKSDKCMKQNVKKKSNEMYNILNSLYIVHLDKIKNLFIIYVCVFCETLKVHFSWHFLSLVWFSLLPLNDFFVSHNI